jgi:adenine-specific DNA-methyltransferase
VALTREEISHDPAGDDEAAETTRGTSVRVRKVAAVPDAAFPLDVLAMSLWSRACASCGADPADRRLLEGAFFEVGMADRLGIAGVPPGSAGVRWLADEYLASLPKATRSRRGSFYTPGSLADALAERVLRNPLPTEGLLIDPACGGGSLLASLVDRLVATGRPDDVVRVVLDRVRGVDLDPVAVKICDLAIRVALLPAWAALPEDARPTLTRFATVGDGLVDSRPAAVVITNPPFGRVRLAEATRRRHSRVLYGHAHWPTLFLHTAVMRLVPGGAAAFVIPASLVGGLYYRRLREFLIREAPPTWLAFVDQRSGVFTGDVLQEALLATFTRGNDDGGVWIEKLRFDASERSPHRTSTAHWTEGRPWLVARDEIDIPLVAAARGRTRRLADYGWRISTGPLVWNRHRAQLHDAPSKGRLPVIWAGDVRDGRVVVRDRPGRYLEPLENQGWLVLRNPALLVQRTTAPEQPRRLVAAILDEATLAALGGEVVIENHLNVCTWNGHGPLSPEILREYLMGDEADRLYRCMTGSVAVSAFELGELPLPDFEERLAEIA